jgi:hypothetical protein
MFGAELPCPDDGEPKEVSEEETSKDRADVLSLAAHSSIYC